MSNNSKGKFIVFYGANNTGKSTQAKLLVDNLSNNGYKTKYLKYPIYDLRPSGSIINEYLRGGNPYKLTPREAQLLYALNRKHFEPELKKILSEGINVVAECYIGTGLAWGEAAGIDPKFLRHINSHLLGEDLAFLFEGPRYKESMERGHKHETNFDLMKKAKESFSRLADEFGWIRINTKDSIHEKEKQIFEYVLEYIQNIDSPHSITNYSRWHQNIPKIIVKKPKNKIKIERLSPLAQLPRARNGYTFNLFAHDFFSIHPGESVAIGTGIKLSMPDNFIALIKSDLGHFSFVIDSSHQKEIQILWFNTTEDIFHVAPGQKIGQLMFQRLTKPNL